MGRVWLDVALGVSFGLRAVGYFHQANEVWGLGLAFLALLMLGVARLDDRYRRRNDAAGREAEE